MHKHRATRSRGAAGVGGSAVVEFALSDSCSMEEPPPQHHSWRGSYACTFFLLRGMWWYAWMYCIIVNGGVSAAVNSMLSEAAFVAIYHFMNTFGLWKQQQHKTVLSLLALFNQSTKTKLQIEELKVLFAFCCLFLSSIPSEELRIRQIRPMMD